jgi:hypothetical protein
MEFSFGILTAGNNNGMLQTIVDSIRGQTIPRYEILIIGTSDISGDDVRILPFDEHIRPKWITKKKNILAQEAKYENLVLLHDYVILENNWYKGFLEFGNDFSFCTTRIKDYDGSRFIDYSFHPFYVGCLDSRFNHGCLLPYDFQPSVHSNKLMYISGTYYIIKTTLARLLPLDEAKLWGEGEDMDLSFAITQLHIQIQCNKYSSVRFLKLKGRAEWVEEIQDPALLQKIIGFTQEDSYKWTTSSYANLLSSFAILKRFQTR